LLLEGSGGLQVRAGLQRASGQFVERELPVRSRRCLGCHGRHLAGIDAHQAAQVGQQRRGAASQRRVLGFDACDLHGE
jgi:hypothetical protein